MVPLLILWIVSAVLLILVDIFNIDLLFSNYFFDFDKLIFPLRNDYFFEKILHQLAKNIVVAIGVLLLILFALSFKYEKIRIYKKGFLYILLVIIFGTSTVGGLKAVSNVPCPWSIKEYNGNKEHYTIFDPHPFSWQLQKGEKTNKCWPAGHASGAFSLIAIYFFCKRYFKQYKNQALIFTVAFAVIISTARTAQGAHFISHNIWTAVICLSYCFIFEILLFAKKQDWS